MSYYVVKYKGKYYLNRAGVKAIFRLGDSGLLNLLSLGKIQAKVLLDTLAYSVSRDDVAKLLEAPFEVQDLGKQVSTLKGKDLTKERSGLNALELDGANKYRFVPLEDICVSDRYRWVKTQAHIKVFGKKYIALSAE
jgi:hypothetical protein